MDQPNRNNTQPRQNSNAPTFKSGAVVSFVAYTAADFLSIIGGCSAVDGFFRKVGLRDARDFGVRYIKRKHKQEFAEISNLTAHITDRLKQKSGAQKASKKLQKTFETIFQTPLKQDHSAKKINGATQSHLDDLYDKVEDLFVNMNDRERFTAIGKPFLIRIEQTLKALNKAEATSKVTSKKDALSGAIKHITQGLQPPIAPKSQHH